MDALLYHPLNTFAFVNLLFDSNGFRVLAFE